MREEEKERAKKRKQEEEEEGIGGKRRTRSLEACNFGNRAPACGKKEKDRGPMLGHRENLSVSPPFCS